MKYSTKKLTGLFSVILLSITTTTVVAQSSYTWNGGSSSGSNWNDGNNWGGTGPSSPQAYLNFAGSTRLINTNDFTADSSGFQIYFNSGAGAFILRGNRIVFYDYSGNDPKIQNDSTTEQTVDFDIDNGNDKNSYALVLDANTGAIIFNGIIQANGGSRVINAHGNSGNNLTFNGVLQDGSSATLSFTKLGGNTAILTANNTYSGQNTINAGTLRLGNGGTSGSPGSGTIQLASGATLHINRSDSPSFANALSLTGGSLTNG